MRKFLYRRAAGIISQTGTARDIMMKIFPETKIIVIGNPIRVINNGRQGLPKENIILTVGRLITTKHHDRLIHIFAKLNAPGWKLLIVGGDALKQNNFRNLQKIIFDLNVSDRVFLEGEKQNVDVYYLRSRIFAFTSSVEGFPNVIGEALSAGLPAISYNCVAGPSEMIQDGENGFLIPVFNDDLFRQKLQLLIDDERLLKEMSVRAKQSIKRFSIENVGEQYYSFITSADEGPSN